MKGRVQNSEISDDAAQAGMLPHRLEDAREAADLLHDVLGNAVAPSKSAIELHNLDALDFMSEVSSGLGEGSLIYLDPPYVQKGPGLYENSLAGADHRALAESVRRYGGTWMVTYDADPLVDELYAPSDGWDVTTGSLAVGYSAARARTVARERLVLGPGLAMPSAW